MDELRLFAGPRARAQIANTGLRAVDFSWLAGASGGPKWFVLYGLDRYLAGEFFNRQDSVLRMIGSSAGAWRLACYAHPDPVRALDTLADLYAGQIYSAQPDRHEISREARGMLAGMMNCTGFDAADVMACSSHRRLYIIADRARRLVRSEKKALLNAGLLAAALGNVFSRRTLPLFFERYVFHNTQDNAADFLLQDYPTRYVPLSAGNICDALMASGSIPVIMESVSHIPGADGAVFRDGGITDYHLDLPFNQQQGLVLFPHFYASVIPGWFDKFAPWRKANAAHFDNVLLVTPSRKFVDSLPYRKIPDRNDFKRLSESERIHYWKMVLEQSRQLAFAFARLVDMGPGVSRFIEPFTGHRIHHL